jgi:pantetheine-phosphate adenylyltransferase
MGNGTRMSITAVYPGTFDPLTLGHEDIVRRASRLFGKVVLGIAESSAKRPIFTLEERVQIAQSVLGPLGNVEIRRFSGLLVNFVHECDAQVVVRGVRSMTDFEYELQLAGMNRHMRPELETIILPPHEEVQYISGTLVREIAMMGGDIGKFVSSPVRDAIGRKLSANSASA